MRQFKATRERWGLTHVVTLCCRAWAFWLHAFTPLLLPTHRSRSLAIRHHAFTRFVQGAQVAKLGGPTSCHRALLSLPTQGLRTLAVRHHVITQQSGIVPSRVLQLPRQRSRSPAIGIVSSHSFHLGKQVAGLDGQALSRRASPSLPLRDLPGH